MTVPVTRVQVHTTRAWEDLELPFGRLPGMIRVIMDGVHVDIVRRDGAVDVIANPQGHDGLVALDVQSVSAHDMQATMRVAASRKPAGFHRDDEGHLL